MQNKLKDQILIPMGHIMGPFGIKGWIKIKVGTEEADSLGQFKLVYLEQHGKIAQYRLENSFVNNNVFHAKFEQVDDRDQALNLKGAVIKVLRGNLPILPDNEYYWADLIGLNIYNKEDLYLGMVIDLMQTGANDVLVVKDKDVTRLIPFVAVYVLEVNFDARKIMVDWGVDY
jgi:16S rRNA processing protein RimM